jgi:hypothetical protein
MEAKPVNRGKETVLQGSPAKILFAVIGTMILVNGLDVFYKSWLHDVATCFNSFGFFIGFMSVSNRSTKTKAFVLLSLFLAVIVPVALALVIKRYF